MLEVIVLVNSSISGLIYFQEMIGLLDRNYKIKVKL